MIGTTAALLTVAALVNTPGMPREASGESRPNFVFVLADDLGWGDLGCFGHRELRTPNLDRMAAQGLRFTQFYVCSGVCSPSRAAFLTGRFPARFGIHGHLDTPEKNARRGMPNWLDPALPTLPRLLQEAGYRTAHFGKWHLGASPDAPPATAYGFDIHRAVNANPDGWDVNQAYFRAQSSRYFMDEALKFIEANRDRPFYVQTWLLLPHAILHPTDDQMKPYQRFAPAKNLPYKGTKPIYYGSVSAIDAQMGRLLKRLDELNLSENTIVVFTSDNGPEDIALRTAAHSGIGSAGPFRARKRSLYEGGVRVPFIVRQPGTVPAGKVDNTSILAGCDLLPTFCALAEVELPRGIDLDGEDRSGLWRGRPQPRTRPLMWEWRFGVMGHVWNKCPILAIREGDYKLLMNPDRSRIELYDIPRDPTEQNNLADAHADIVERMATQVLAWQKTLPPGPLDADAGTHEYPWPK